MSQSDRFDNFNNEQEEVNTSYDTYTTDSSADIYNTPNVDSASSDNVSAEDIVVADHVIESVPEEEPAAADIVVESSPVPQNTNQGDVPYDNAPYNNVPYNNPYNNNPYNNSYNTNPYNGNQYNNQPDNNQYGGYPYGSNTYGARNTQSTNPYGGYQYGNSQYGNNQYGNSQYGSNQYGNNQYGNNQYGNGPAGTPPYGNNQYSPYAAPAKKNRTGLIIGVVITIILLFLIAVFALVYRLMSINTRDTGTGRGNRDEYRFDDNDDWRTDRNKGEQKRDPDNHRDWFDYDDDDDDYDDDYYDDFDDWFDYDDDYSDDGMYYDLHDDIRTDLSYSVDIEDYDYDTDNDNVDIWVEYPVIEGDNVPNLDKLNDAFRDEVNLLTELFEDEYEEYMVDDDSYFMAYSVGYVTYMDEEKMSVVFDERIYSDYYADVYLYCINIDMENGVIMDNENILSIDDDFSVDFRERNDIQNGEIDYLTMLTDQEITKHFNSSDVIVFYTPMGMEIGFNYDEGWVTVTYEDYKQYLKVF